MIKPFVPHSLLVLITIYHHFLMKVSSNTLYFTLGQLSHCFTLGFQDTSEKNTCMQRKDLDKFQGH